MSDLAYPIKLNDSYPCQGTDANGCAIVFPDLLREGEQVGPSDEDDGGEALFVSGVVVRRPDGLWCEALT